MRFVTISLLIISVTFSLFGYNGFSRDYNHPEIEWSTIETPRLKIHFQRGLRKKAEEIGKISENLIRIYEEKYKIKMPTKTDIVVQDSDFPGGWAAPVLNTISIDVHEFDFRLRGTHDWLQNVVTHELAHLLSIRSALKFPPWMPDIRVGYFDYYNEKNQASFFNVISSDILPQWFAEGIAQFEAANEGSDSWDTHRDMILRASVMQNRTLPYDEMCVFSGKSLNWEKAYNHGYSLVSYIAETHGYQAIISLLRESAVLHHQSFNGSIKRVLGMKSSKLYENWVKHLRDTYSRQIKGIGDQVFGEKITEHGFNTAHPRWSKDGSTLYFLSNWKSDYGYLNLYKYTFDNGEKDKSKKTKMLLPGIASSYNVTRDGKKILYISAEKRDKHKNPRPDIFIKRIKPKRKFLLLKDDEKKRLTKNLSILDADYSSDEVLIAAVKKHKSNDWLAAINSETGKVRYLFPGKKIGDSAKNEETNIYSPRISPDGTKIAFSFFDGTSRQIGLIDTGGSAFYSFFQSGFDDRDPSWSPDGKWIIFSSDRTGIFNLYKKNVKSGEVIKLTNVSGGAFYPEYAPDGERIAYVNYDGEGYGLYMTKDTLLEKFHDKPIALSDSTPPKKELAIVKPVARYDFRPKKLLFSPIVIGQERIAENDSATSGVRRWLGGGILNLLDPLNKNYLGALLLLQMDKGLNIRGDQKEYLIDPGIDREFSVFYENRMFAPTLSTEFNMLSIHDLDRFWNEDIQDTSEVKYQISLLNFGLAPRIQVTPNQKFHLIADYFSSSTLFYNIPFFPKYNYLEGWRAGAIWTLLRKGRNTASNIAPTGSYLKLKLDHWRNNLIKDNFNEAFTIENGKIVANMDRYEFNMGKLSLKYGMRNPLYGKHIFGLQADAVAIDQDVHSFFQVGPFLKGYPFLRNRDSLYASGNKALQVEASYHIPISKDVNKSFFFLFLDQIYLKTFFEAGGAWTKSIGDFVTEINEANWLKSVGTELRLECISYNVYPFSTYLQTTYAFDNPVSDDRLRWNFGVTFSFDNWELIDIPDFLSRNIRTIPSFSN